MTPNLDTVILTASRAAGYDLMPYPEAPNSFNRALNLPASSATEKFVAQNSHGQLFVNIYRDTAVDLNCDAGRSAIANALNVVVYIEL